MTQNLEKTRNPRRGRAAGGDWILNVPPYPLALWGDRTQVAAAKEEGTLLCGPVGAGKTTLAQRYVRARLGLDDGEVLGMHVARAEKPIVYLAMDRPAQIARSFRRMTDENDRPVLNEKLHVWQGPLPPSAVAAGSPWSLRNWIRDEYGDVAEVIVDSYKDLGLSLVDDEQANALNLMMQACIADGIDWFGLHHFRKSNGDNKVPNSIDDVYGSRWLTAGVGSVLCLWGDPGGETGDLTHLKQPAEPVGPMMVFHDRPNGNVTGLAGEVQGTRAHQRVRRAKILHAINDGNETVEAIALATGEKDRTIRDDLAGLKSQGRVRQTGAARATRYSVVFLGEESGLSDSA